MVLFIDKFLPLVLSRSERPYYPIFLYLTNFCFQEVKNKRKLSTFRSEIGHSCLRVIVAYKRLYSTLFLISFRLRQASNTSLVSETSQQKESQ